MKKKQDVFADMRQLAPPSQVKELADKFLEWHDNMVNRGVNGTFREWVARASVNRVQSEQVRKYLESQGIL